MDLHVLYNGISAQDALSRFFRIYHHYYKPWLPHGWRLESRSSGSRVYFAPVNYLTFTDAFEQQCNNFLPGILLLGLMCEKQQNKSTLKYIDPIGQCKNSPRSQTTR